MTTHPHGPYLSAEEAAALLGVRVDSLYAYVSRGLLQSGPTPGNSRARRYLRADVERLRQRQELRRDPSRAGETSLTWGAPVLESAITLLDAGRIFYRGHDVAALARSQSVEAVASLLWTGTLDSPSLPRDTSPHSTIGDISQIGDLKPLARFQARLPLLAAQDLAAYDLRPEAVVRTGWRILWEFVRATGDAPVSDDAATGMVATLQRGWGLDATGVGGEATVRLLNAALVLCADHELNVSSFTVRCIASARAPLYAAVSGGLSALLGTKHGGASLRVEALFDDVERGTASAVVAGYLRRGEALPGFGHQLYPTGDPRPACMLDLLAEVDPDAEAVQLGEATRRAVAEAVGEAPNLEFGLVVVSRWLGLPPGSALTLLALGRTLGWVAHALEEYARDQLIRPRARYVGVVPVGDG